MARRGRRERKANISVPSAITPRSLTPRLLGNVLQPSPRQLVEDRRTYHPLEFFRPARTVSGTNIDPVVVKKSRPFKAALPFGLRFSVPDKTLICVRRKERKEVLFAKRKTKKGSGSKKRKNWFSKIGC